MRPAWSDAQLRKINLNTAVRREYAASSLIERTLRVRSEHYLGNFWYDGLEQQASATCQMQPHRGLGTSTTAKRKRESQ
jgi:hypothetical protein